MTAEEIKQSVSMKDVLERYGVKVNRHNMCCCPLHGEKHASMKVFPDGYNCFACGANGDIFSFVMAMERCSFKEAFLHLGGSYKRTNRIQKKLLQAKYERAKVERKSKTDFEADFRKMLDDAIHKCRLIINHCWAFSEQWCEAQNALPWLENVWDLKYLKDEEIDKADVIRVCKRIERIRYFV